MTGANSEWRVANRERRSLCKRRDPLISRHPPQEAGRVGHAELVSRCVTDRSATRASNAPRIRPLFPDWRTRSFWLSCMVAHAAALAPYDHEPVQRVRVCRKTLDPAVSCPAGNASAVRFARWSVGPVGLSQRWGRCCFVTFVALLVSLCFQHEGTKVITKITKASLPSKRPCRAGRCSDIPKVRCTSKSSHVSTRTSVRAAQLGRIDF